MSGLLSTLVDAWDANMVTVGGQRVKCAGIVGKQGRAFRFVLERCRL